MLKQKLAKILGLNGVSIIIGIVGGLFGFFSIFVTDWNSPISLKWLVFVSFLSFSIILVLSSLISDLLKEIRIKLPNKAKAFRYFPESNQFLVEKNDSLGASATVTIFYLDDEYEVTLGTGYVSNIQDKFISINIIEMDNNFIQMYQNIITQIEANDIRVISKIFVKSYLIYRN
jgi:hypothetical protein